MSTEESFRVDSLFRGKEKLAARSSLPSSDGRRKFFFFFSSLALSSLSRLGRWQLVFQKAPFFLGGE